ncbi:hypothetical protein J2T58_001720 [Methanocalculus alkaliphilus]|nr:hypothetical protein [Methanocalculus alkaliphilus]
MIPMSDSDKNLMRIYNPVAANNMKSARDPEICAERADNRVVGRIVKKPA